MKNLIAKSTFIFVLIGASLGIASDSIIDEETNKEYRVMSPAELSETDIQQFCKGNMEGVVLSIEGTTLLVNIDLNSDIFEGQTHTARRIKVLKPCFMKCSKGVHSFSSDYRNWKPFKEYFDTDLDVSMDICPETSLVKLTLYLDLHEKQK